MAEYEYLWRNKWITSDATNIDEMIESYEFHLDLLKQFRAAGLQPHSEMGDDYAFFFTKDKEVAEKFGFQEVEYEDEDDFEESEISLN